MTPTPDNLAGRLTERLMTVINQSLPEPLTGTDYNRIYSAVYYVLHNVLGDRNGL